jgi:RNA polymerase sigma-70 factor (ECF subfamily)
VQTSAKESGRTSEFAAFMQAYQDMVYSTAARLTGNPAQAQDIAQDVFLKAFEHFEQLRDSPTAGGWLKTVATNNALNHLSRYRKRWRFFSEVRQEDDSQDDGVFDVPVPDTLFDDLAAHERHHVVEQAVAGLPQHQRLPLVMFHFQEMSYEDIARTLNISLSKVKTDILRGRASLARTLAARSRRDDI